MTNQTISNKLVDELKSAGVNFFVSVPCKLLSGQIRLLEDDANVCYLPVTREEEGLDFVPVQVLVAICLAF